MRQVKTISRLGFKIHVIWACLKHAMLFHKCPETQTFIHWFCMRQVKTISRLGFNIHVIWACLKQAMLIHKCPETQTFIHNVCLNC